MLGERLKAVKKEVSDAAVRSGRDPEDILILAVSKTKPAEAVKELYDAGHRDFGENYVQELEAKRKELPGDIRWHMIGHLQRNKVKYIAPYIAMIHSVDSAALADTIEKEAAKCGRVIDVLIEVNVAGEESKYGVESGDVQELAAHIVNLPHVRLRGLMTSAPITDDPEEVRPVFRRLRELGLGLKSLDIYSENNNNCDMDFLSMGMSGDYGVAVEEGSSCVRVGTKIFGERQYFRGNGMTNHNS